MSAFVKRELHVLQFHSSASLTSFTYRYLSLDFKCLLLMQTSKKKKKVICLNCCCLVLLECMLGPPGDEEKNTESNPQHTSFSHPPSAHPFAHNAFHVWDQDDVVIPLSQDESPQSSPLLLAAIPYIPSFFPHPHSLMNHSPHAATGSPGPTKEISIPREF